MRDKTHSNFQIDFWPGFVDALSSLLIVLIFTLVIFMVSQLSLSEALRGSTEETNSLQSKLSEISSELNVTTKQRDILNQSLQNAHFATLSAEEKVERLSFQVQELNEKLSLLAQALELSENQSYEKQLKIDELGQQLTEALAHKMHQLEKYRSEFFGKLQEILGDRSDIKISGDRFVFQSEVLFPSASATLSPKGKEALTRLAGSLKEIATTIPEDIAWILRIDGHTDNLPLKATSRFASNWELSAARAIAVVNFLVKQGLPADHLAATGFGEYHPLEAGNTAQVRAKNRRIEIKLDQI